VPIQLVWSDECDGGPGQQPDPALWELRETDEWQPAAELQTYTRDVGNAHYDGQGHLVIAAVQRGGRTTSARLRGRRLFRYGYFEARIRLPECAGAWPAWWLLGEDDRFGWPECGEIDVMEAPVGPETTGQVHQGTHSPAAPGEPGAKGAGVPPTIGRWYEDFHTYGARWEPGAITFVIDDHETGTVTRSTVEEAGGQWRFDERSLAPVLNVAVGGWAGAPGRWDSAEMVVDWVRVWA
jgi:beta-glucanase (GH16 family)